jgi:hypothetical protein
MRTIRHLLVFALFVTATAYAQTKLSDSDVARLIATVQAVSASELDSSLPATPFDEWLHRQLPEGLGVGWAVRTPSTGTPQDVARSMPWVEVDISKQGQPVLAIFVVCKMESAKSTTRPKVRSIVQFKGEIGELVELGRLREISAALNN